MPGIGSTLKGAGLPGRFLAGPVQVITEEGRLDVLAELARGFMPTKGDQANAVGRGSPPLPVEPRARHHEIGMLRIVLFGVTEDLPRSPGVFLVPESGHIQVGHGGSMQLADPGLFFPEAIVVRMLRGRVPEWDRPV